MNLFKITEYYSSQFVFWIEHWFVCYICRVSGEMCLSILETNMWTPTLPSVHMVAFYLLLALKWRAKWRERLTVDIDSNKDCNESYMDWIGLINNCDPFVSRVFCPNLTLVYNTESPILVKLKLNYHENCLIIFIYCRTRLYIALKV